MADLTRDLLPWIACAIVVFVVLVLIGFGIVVFDCAKCGEHEEPL